MNLPMLELRTPDGAPFSWAGLWQRHNLLLLFGHPGCERCLRVLATWASRPEALEAENAVALAVYPADPGEVPAGVRVLLNPEGRLAGRLGAAAGTMVATDRFFEILAMGDVHGQPPEAIARDGLDWVRLAERRCDECGAPTW